MRNPAPAFNIYKFNPGTRHKQVVVRGFAAVTAMMKPVSIDVGLKFCLNLAGLRVPAGKDTDSPPAGCLARPY
jgi:hypothetical protein